MAETDITGAFGAVKSESRYLNDRLDVKGARTKLFDANNKLVLAQRAFSGVSANDKGYQAAADAVKTAQAKVDEAKQEVARIESIAKTDYRQAKSKIDVKKEKSQIDKINDEITAANAGLQRLKDSGQSTAQQEEKIADLIAKRDKTGKYAIKQDTGNVVDQSKQDQQSVRDYGAELTSAGKFIYGKKDPKDLIALGTLLKDAGYYDYPVTGTPNDLLVAAYQKAIQENLVRTNNVGSEVSLSDFLVAKARERKELGLGGAGGPTVTQSRSISTPLEAASRVEAIFKSELGRMPTPQEIEKYSKRLIDKEKKQSSYTKTTSRKVGGVTVTDTTGGLDRDQFLQELVRKSPEYSQRKAETRSLSVQTLQGVANDNGVTLSQQQLDQYARDVENGKNINVIANQIRALAGLGMPDNVKKLLAEGTDLSTIYSPYKKTMASILEISPESISLSDPLLRSAINQNGEISLYEFQRQLRKDPRWQYTDNARESVSTAALGILRDFGFQG
jgi:hypothetical protein